jgi:thiamine pyrophosphate-dependent acetolactate synthase large subunit-like protein
VVLDGERPAAEVAAMVERATLAALSGRPAPAAVDAPVAQGASGVR